MQTIDTNTPPSASAKPLPTETPKTAFGAAEGVDGADRGPMANFGFTVAAYSVLWVVLGAFLLSTWRKQQALDKRLASLESAIAKGPPKAAGPSGK